MKHGSMLDSDSVSTSITIHDLSGVATVNMKQATGGSSENPFLNGSMLSNSSSAQAVQTVNSESVRKKRITHAALMIVAFVLLFPLIVLGIPLFPSCRTVVIHAGLQLSTLALVIAGFGLGISMAISLDLVGSYHPIIGIVVITLGIINAGLGFRLTGIGTSVAPTGAVIAYGVVAGLVWVSYVLIVGFLSYRARQSRS